MGEAIVTLTMNPALDITTDVDEVRHTDKMRCGDVRYDPGGGGINVARVAQVLGTDVTAVFPVGGPTGGALTRMLHAAGLATMTIPIAGSTRESFTVNERSTGRQYRFVLPGPTLSCAEQAGCLDTLRNAIGVARLVVASGSLPPGVPPDFYQRVADLCQEHGAPFILDTSGKGLRHIKSGISLLKASIRELRECSGRSLDSEFEQVDAARKLIAGGCANVVVISCGSNGALLVTISDSKRFSAVPVSGGSGVGAGDAMVAAIVVGLSRGWAYDKSVQLGVAAGAAMLQTPGTAVCALEEIQRLFELAPEPVVID